MLQVEIIHPDGTSRTVQVPADAMIGKSGQSEIRLDNWRIGKEHAHLFRSPAGILVEDMGAFGGVSINGQRFNGQSGPLKPGDVIGIGPYKLKVSDLGSADIAAPVPERPREASASSVAPVAEVPVPSAEVARRQQEFEWRRHLHGRLLEVMDLRRQDVHHMSDDRLRAETSRLIAEILDELDAEIPAELDREALSKQVLDEAIGLGPLEELLNDDSVTEIMVDRKSVV